MDEYEADKCAVNLAGADNVARALIYTELKAKFLEGNFWDKFYKQVNDLIEPPANCFTQVSNALSEDIPRQNYLEWLDQSLQQKTNTADTHPCLTDRLNAIGYKFNAEEFKLITPKFNAADAYLKDKLPVIIEHFNDNWRLEVATNWRQRYAYIQEGKLKLYSLNEEAKVRDLTADECYARDYWVGEILGEDGAFSYLEVDVKKYPDHSNLNYAFVCIFL
jgi:hypothetical protein